MAALEKPIEAQTVSARRTPHPLRVSLLLATGFLAAFVALALARQSEATAAFDSAVTDAADRLRSSALTPWIVQGTNLGAFSFAGVVAAVLVAVLLLRRLWTAAAVIVIVYGIGYYWASIAQEVVRRIRPPQAAALIPVPQAFSFPSGHSITAMLLYGAIGFLVWRASRRTWLRILGVAVCVLLIVFVGFTRVYLGVHWPSDVLGAWLLGGAWLAAIAGVYVWWEKRLAEANRPS